MPVFKSSKLDYYTSYGHLKRIYTKIKCSRDLSVLPLFASNMQHSSLKPCTLLLLLQNEVRVGLMVPKIICAILYFNPPVQKIVAYLMQTALQYY